MSSLCINTETASYAVNNISLNCFISLLFFALSILLLLSFGLSGKDTKTNKKVEDDDMMQETEWPKEKTGKI